MKKSKMKLFKWKAVNQLQQKQQGMIVAKNEDIAKTLLFNRKLQNIKLQRNWQFSRKPKLNELYEFINQLALLLKAALPLKQSLLLLQRDCTIIQLNIWISEIISALDSGLSFSQSIEKQGKYFSQQELQLLKVGEMTASLPQVCHNIAQYRQRSLKLKRKVQKILLYPIVVFCISSILTILLLVFVVPQFAEMYEANHSQLPSFTVFLIALSELLQTYLLHSILLVVLCVIFIRIRLKHSQRLVRLKNQCIFYSPILGKITKLSRLINFSGTLSLMLYAKVPLNIALQSFLPKQASWQIQKSYVGDQFLNQAIETALYWLNLGYSLSDSVSSDFFPLEAQQMLKIGEESGQVAQMLQHISEKYQQDLDHQVDLLSQLLEPMLMLIIGGLIGAVLLGMYLPIFNMGAMIQ
ncbi:Cholera toxin secretion protein epsF [Avibacterium paragallinarum]|uniref:Cholera toxin secretion protein epsF n=3 Tax=Avibacterium paragallinarum TaxID=728 RepID=A0A0F5F1A4_AVIPA|nr:type II secretion system protein F [Avibacterium paragallinarum]SUU98232.1 Cholera toxin secretion protein epsF [Avibacterium paragallinarum]